MEAYEKSKRNGGAQKNAQTPPACQVCRQPKAVMVPAVLVRPMIIEEIRKVQLDFSTEGYICADDLNNFRFLYIQEMLASEKGELTNLDRDVLESLKEHDLLSSNLNVAFDKEQTFGEALADKIAEFGGSWKFIILFSAILVIWIGLNSAVLLWKPFDPYPFILLNLVLSCLAAMQAPVIMMSQNRQEDKDRLRAEHDYRINLKAELEIRHLHEKIDHLLSRQWERLVEIQQIQIELMTELSSHRS
ncbi:MAG: DUF1003 domain-containing protein [Desulfosarcinaceae bacterium]